MGIDLDTHCKIKEGLDCIRVGEVTKALEKMKKHKALGLSGVFTEIMQATGVTSIDWLTEYIMAL